MITDLQENDVLFGRGNGNAFFSGNINFRRVAGNHRDAYANLAKVNRKELAHQVLKEMIQLDPPSRFLQPSGNGFVEVSEERVIEKICQILREKKFHVPTSSDRQRVINSQLNRLTVKKATSTLIDKSSKNAKTKVTKKTKNAKILRSLAKPPTKRIKDYDKQNAMQVSLEKLYTIDLPIVTPGSFNRSGYISEDLHDEMNNQIPCSSFQANSEGDTDHDLSHYPLIPRVLFPEEMEYDGFGPSQNFLPELELACPEESDNYLAEALNDDRFDPFPDHHLDCFFDPFADECQENFATDIPPSLAAFFSTYRSRTTTPRAVAVDSPTTVWEMDGSFAILQ